MRLLFTWLMWLRVNNWKRKQPQSELSVCTADHFQVIFLSCGLCVCYNLLCHVILILNVVKCWIIPGSSNPDTLSCRSGPASNPECDYLLIQEWDATVSSVTTSHQLFIGGVQELLNSDILAVNLLSFGQINHTQVGWNHSMAAVLSAVWIPLPYIYISSLLSRLHLPVSLQTAVNSKVPPHPNLLFVFIFFPKVEVRMICWMMCCWVCAESDTGRLFLHPCTGSGKSALIENPVRGGEITSRIYDNTNSVDTKDAAEFESFKFCRCMWENLGNKRTISETNCDRRTCSMRCDS